MSHSHRFFATAARGTEAILADELSRIGCSAVTSERGGAAFGTSLEDGYRACLWSRVASRVLLPIGELEATSPEALYAGVHDLSWSEHIEPHRTLAVAVTGSGSPIGPGQYIALKTKDAIVDRVRADRGTRPSIDKRDPDLRVQVHVGAETVIVSLDLAGHGLHRRGLDRPGSTAPIKESLAAALLYMTGWPARSAELPLVDPMCGSGTFLLEAAAIALDVAPGLTRGEAGARGWQQHDTALWRRLRDEAQERRAAAAQRTLRIAGSDASARSVRDTRRLIARAGFAEAVTLGTAELGDARPPWDDPGVVITNPPYGARLGDAAELGQLYELLGDVLKRRFTGWAAWVLSGDRALDKRIGLRPASRAAVFNGPIDCRLLEIPIAAAAVAGDGPAWRSRATRGPASRGPASRGPATRGPETTAAPGLGKRLRNNLRHLRPWAKRERISCYRVYDSEIPQYNLAVDCYDGVVRVEEYAAPKNIPEADASRRLDEALPVIAHELGVDRAALIVRVRRRRRAHEQHGRVADSGRLVEVHEGDFRFLVNLTDYLDTGLYLDDRLLRARLFAEAAGHDFLNLFAHTCTATVAAAKGGARSTVSVDLSNRSLEWGRKNLQLNGLTGPSHRLERSDVLRYLKTESSPWSKRHFGLIFLTPPTWSRSKAMSGEFDIQRDHVDLIRQAATRLTEDGLLLFTTNLRSFRLDPAGLTGLRVAEITKQMLPPDFSNRPRVKAWEIRPYRAR